MALTFQDFQAVGEYLDKQQMFFDKAIAEHQGSALYRTAADAEKYYKHENPTIMRVQNLLYDATGKAHINEWSPNHKIPSRFFPVIVDQEVQTLLGNGITFSGADTEDKLGKDFYNRMIMIARNALIGGVAFGFWNLDHIDIFKVTEFVPFYDEETSALRAGLRWWQLEAGKPMRYTLYEEDGYTEYIKRGDNLLEIYAEKRPYITITQTSAASGTEIVGGRNYASFPIVPLRNTEGQSLLEWGRQQIDSYDLVLSGMVNTIDEGNLVYWVLKNCGGMDDSDLSRFVHRIASTKVASLDEEDGDAEPHVVNAPVDAPEVALTRLRKQIFEDFMALDVTEIAAGDVTATQIEAAYEPLNSKLDNFENEVTAFINGILLLAGIDDAPTYTRSQMANVTEIANLVMSAGNLLPEDYKTKKLLTLLGDADQYDDIIKQLTAEESSRYTNQNQQQNEEENEVE